MDLNLAALSAREAYYASPMSIEVSRWIGGYLQGKFISEKYGL
ncbi:hypothetical protein AM1_0039 [Acaryochloris marina MBIC11017]|uniref:Uncharacterized protein n=1 Tax=Acaryochloris marina (strain MBIC 11017) TaxID=329726 RepID=B0C515_ACAM1|nr:hypothetical protein AM1_0039 [Acaryochloris marina MBIC11017]